MNTLLICNSNSVLIAKATISSYHYSKDEFSGESKLSNMRVELFWADWLEVYRATQQDKRVQVCLIAEQGQLITGEAYSNTFSRFAPATAVESLSVSITDVISRSEQPLKYKDVLSRFVGAEKLTARRVNHRHLSKMQAHFS